MQKFYSKHKDDLWIVFLSILFTWIISKLLDHLYTFLITVPGATSLYLPVWVTQALKEEIPLYYVASFSLSFILGYFVVLRIQNVIQRIKIKKRKLEILHATYGKNENQINITNELNNAVLDNTLSIVLSNNVAGDPCPGVPKIGKIKYQYSGKVTEREYTEGEFIILPTPLFEQQTQAILALLSSFGAERERIIKVEKVLRGVD